MRPRTIQGRAVRKAVVEAIDTLSEDKPSAFFTITEIVEQAGVSRSSARLHVDQLLSLRGYSCRRFRGGCQRAAFAYRYDDPRL